MKNRVIISVCVAVIAVGAAYAGPNNAIKGALLGTGVGLIIGNNVDGVDQEVAAPVLGVTGALIGHQMDKREKRKNRRLQHGRREQMPRANTRVHTPDLHPGVDLIKISILHSNGIRTDIPILRTGTKFIGPQGEEYHALPTSKQLAKRYGM